jgi:hypothetical protein
MTIKANSLGIKSYFDYPNRPEFSIPEKLSTIDHHLDRSCLSGNDL